MKNKKLSAVLLFFVALHTFVMFPLAPLWAQSEEVLDIDISAPVIHHNVLFQEKQAGVALKIEASVTDDAVVGDVMLYYRSGGDQRYTGIKMQSDGKEHYSITIPKEKISGVKLEYYIHAFDESGNNSLRGDSFIPLSIALVLKKNPEKKPWYKKWWVWTIITAVVAGGFAASGIGHDGANTGTVVVN